MGPVSFDKIRVGRERTGALEAARRVAAAGIRLDLVEPDPSRPGAEFSLMVRSDRYQEARLLVEETKSEHPTSEQR